MGQEASKPDPNVKLQVIRCGMSRTGTASFSEALKILLGFCLEVQYIMVEVRSSVPARSTFESGLKCTSIYLSRRSKLEGGPPRTQVRPERIHSRVTDLPPIFSTEEVVEIFPNAHVICTIRDPEAWRGSVEAITARTDTEERDENIFRFILALLPTMRYWYAVNIAPKQGRMGELYCSSGHKNPHAGQYQDHMGYITRVVPPKRLKSCDVKDGWSPCARF